MKKLIKIIPILLAVCLIVQFLIPESLLVAQATENEGPEQEYQILQVIEPVGSGGLLISSSEAIVPGTDFEWDEMGHVLTILSGSPLALSNTDPGTALNMQILIPENVPAQLTLAGVNIYTASENPSEIKDCLVIKESTANVRITLEDGTVNHLGASNGIIIHKDGGQDSGMLTLDGDGYLMAEGSIFTYPIIGTAGTANNPKETSNITISGGHYNFENTGGGSYAAAIGGGYNAYASNICIAGGSFMITGFYNGIGGGADPYTEPCGSSKISVSKNASVSCANQKDRILSAETSEQAYLLVIENPNGETVYLDGQALPLKEHRMDLESAEEKLYVYLDAGTNENPHEVRIGDSVKYYVYDADERMWTESQGSPQQQIRFKEQNPVLMYEEGLTYQNELINDNEDSTVVYSIDKPEIAAIDGSGRVTILECGTATIHAVSKKDGCIDTSAYYKLSVKEGHEIIIQASGGTVTAEKDKAVSGEKVTLTLIPDGVNRLNSLKALTESGKKLSYNSETNSFIMPDCDVTITAEFVDNIYDIKMNQDTHGYVKAPATAMSGETVTLKASPDTGYELDSVQVVQTSDGTEVPFSLDTLSFVMPESNVEISSSFKITTYEIKLLTPATGEIFCDKKTAAKGEKVTLTLTIPEDSELNSVTVINSKGKNITLTKEDENTYSFVMPADNVTASAVFDRLAHKIILNTGEHGTVTTDLSEASPGTEVRVSVSPESSYSLSYIQIVPDTELQKINSTTYSFIMPDAGIDVTVVSTFAQASEGTISNPWFVGTKDHEEEVVAYMSSDTELHIEGSGEIKNFADRGTPWYSLFNSLESLVVHEGVTRIGNRTLYHFNLLNNFKSVELPESLLSIGDYSLSRMSATTELTIPANVKTIGSHAFDGSKRLHKFTFEGKPDSIAEDAFATITADVYIPESWVADGTFNPTAHQYGGKLTYHIYGTDEEFLVNTGTYAHGNLIADKTVAEAGDKVTIFVEEETGWYMTSCMIRPNTELSKNADGTYSFIMPDCDVNLEAVFGQPGDKEHPWCVGADNLTDVKAWFDPEAGTLYFSSDKMNVQMMDFTVGTRPWESIAPQVKYISFTSGIENIGENAFSGFTSLTDASLGSIADIGEKAFFGCSNLETIREFALTTIENIGASAFENCSALAVDHFDAIESMGNRCFANCASIETMSLNGNLTAIPAEAFSGCTGLAEIIMSESVEEIGDKAFSGCSSLREIAIPANIEKLGSGSFENCKELKKITYKGKKPEIASDAFKNDLAYVYVNYDFFDSNASEVVQINDPNGTYYFGAKQLSYIVSAGGKKPERHMVHVNQTTGGKVYLSYVPEFERGTCFILLESWGDVQRGEIVSVEPNINLVRQDWIDMVPGYENKDYYSFEMPASDVTFTVKFKSNETPIPDPPQLPEDGPKNRWEVGKVNASDVIAYVEGDTLYFAGTGEIKDFDSMTAPWYSRKDIKKAVFSEGITNTGEWNLFQMTELSEIELPSTMETLDARALFDSSVKQLTVPAAVSSIGYNLFYNDSIKDVYFEGKPETIDSKAFDGCTCEFYVGSDWLANGVTIDDLNDPSGDYQFGGSIHYTLLGDTLHEITTDATEGGEIFASRESAYENELITVTAVPEYGYYLNEIQIRGMDFTEKNKYFIMPSVNVDLYGIFDPIYSRINIAKVSGLSVTANRQGAEYKDKVRLTVTEELGYRFLGVSVTDAEGNNIPLDEEMCFVMPASEVTVTAKSEPLNYDVIEGSANHGRILISQNTATVGTTITLTHNADPHYLFAKWQVVDAEGKEVDVNNNRFKMPAMDVTVNAVFEPARIISVTTTAGGTVEGNPGSSLANEKVTLIPKAKSGYEFVRWESEDVTIENNTFTVPEKDVVIQAVFARIGYDITAETSGHGTVEVPKTAEAGATVVVQTKPDFGSSVKNIYVATEGGVMLPVKNNRFQMPNSAVTVTIVFEGEHTCENPEEVTGKEATCTMDGYKACWKCICGEYYEDEACTKPILDYNEWIIGEGKIPAGHKYVVEQYTADQHRYVCRNDESHTYTENHTFDGNICTECGYVRDTRYLIIYGAGSEWTKGSSEGCLITSDAPYAKFESVEVEGNLLAETNYTSKEGSTEITLKPEYLETLSLGKHSIKIVSSDGSASTYFIVNPAEEPSEPVGPDTGDDNNIILWLVILFGSAALLGAAVYCRRKMDR